MPEPVSPADTIRRELYTYVNLDAEQVTLRREDVLALLAVGERDKAEIEALTAAVEGLLDVGKRSRSGDPSLDPEEWYAIRDYAEKVLKDGGGAVLREARERDRRHIAQLTAEVERLLDCRGATNGTVSRRGGEPAVCRECAESARAVLAVEEDAE